MLVQYQQLTRRLLNDMTFAQIDDFDLFDYVNTARRQVALDAECVRFFATKTVPAGLAVVPIATLDLGTTAGVAQAVVVRSATLDGTRINIRSWDWFSAYNLGPAASTTPVMAHQGQGTLSVLYISSQNGGALKADVVAMPADLSNDTTVEQLPHPFTDAVPFYAAYYAYMMMQRQEEANLMLQRYHDVMRRGRSGVTSTNLPGNDPGGSGTRIASGMQTLGAPGASPTRGEGR